MSIILGKVLCAEDKTVGSKSHDGPYSLARKQALLICYTWTCYCVPKLNAVGGVEESIYIYVYIYMEL